MSATANADLRPERAITIAVGLLVLAFFVLAAAPAPTLLDSAELAEAAYGLGVAHPPGEPLAALWGKLFTLLPLGSVAFRVALGQGAAAALASVLVMRVAFLTSPASSADPRVVRLVVAAAAFLFAVAPGVIVSAARPEVYALQAAMSLATLELALRAARTSDLRPAVAAAALIGLGMGVHPLLAGLLGLGAVVAALPLLRRAPIRLPVISVCALLAGAAVLSYLPVRAATHPSLDWGDAHTLERLAWLLSARTFAAKAGVIHENTSVADAPFILVEEMGVVAFLLAALGAYGMLRQRSTRPAAVAVLVTGGGALVAAGIAGLDHANPDIRGYLMGALACEAVLAAGGALLVLQVLAARRVRLALAAAACLVAVAVVRAPAGLAQGGRRHSTAAAVMGVRMLATLPPRALWLTSDFQTGFLTGYLRTVEGWRPDVSWVHLGFAGGPGYTERMIARRPAVAGVLDAFEHRSGFARALDAFDAGEGPVRIEADSHLGDDVVTRLRPDGLGWRLVQTSDTAYTPSAAPAGRLEDPVSDLLAAAGGTAADHEVRGFIAWRLYSDALLACRAGLAATAEQAVARLRALRPDDLRAQALATQCAAALHRGSPGFPPAW